MKKRIFHVNDEETLADCAARLAERQVIGVDSESNSMHVYREQVCYLQIAGGDDVFLVDTLALRDLSALVPVFADPARLAILHGADYDVVCLGRDFGMTFGRLFDTMIAAQILGKESLGLAALSLAYFGVEMDKSLTKHDWGRRPLEEKYVEYLIEDVLHLEELRDLLAAELAAADLEEEFRIECERVAALAWSEKKFDPDGFGRIKGVRDLSPAVKVIVKALWCARESIAEAEGLPPFKIAHNEALLAAARGCAANNSTDAGRAFRGQIWRKYGDRIRGAVADALAGRIELVRPVRTERPPRHVQAAQDALRAWRRDRAAERELPPVVVLPNHAMMAMLDQPPRSLADLEAFIGIGPKRCARYGKEILEIIARHFQD